MKRHRLVALLLCGGAITMAAGRGCTPPVDLPDPPPVVQPVSPGTAVTYFYEKNQTAIPAAVQAGIDQLNRRDIVATIYENDNTDGDDDVPEQYRVSLVAARGAGLPALVVMNGDKVVNVVKSPVTLEAVTGAVR